MKKRTKKEAAQEALVLASERLLIAARANARAGGDTVGIRDERTIDPTRSSLRASHAWVGGGLATFGHGNDHPLTAAGALAYVAGELATAHRGDIGELAIHGPAYVDYDTRAARAKAAAESADRKMLFASLRALREQRDGAHGSEHGGDCPHRKRGYERSQRGCDCGFARVCRSIERLEKHLGVGPGFRA